jgi:hypothetical protein
MSADASPHNHVVGAKLVHRDAKLLDARAQLGRSDGVERSHSVLELPPRRHKQRLVVVRLGRCVKQTLACAHQIVHRCAVRKTRLHQRVDTIQQQLQLRHGRAAQNAPDRRRRRHAGTNQRPGTLRLARPTLPRIRVPLLATPARHGAHGEIGVPPPRALLLAVVPLQQVAKRRRARNVGVWEQTRVDTTRRQRVKLPQRAGDDRIGGHPRKHGAERRRRCHRSRVDEHHRRQRKRRLHRALELVEERRVRAVLASEMQQRGAAQLVDDAQRAVRFAHCARHKRRQLIGAARQRHGRLHDRGGRQASAALAQHRRRRGQLQLRGGERVVAAHVAHRRHEPAHVGADLAAATKSRTASTHWPKRSRTDADVARPPYAMRTARCHASAVGGTPHLRQHNDELAQMPQVTPTHTHARQLLHRRVHAPRNVDGARVVHAGCRHQPASGYAVGG